MLSPVRKADTPDMILGVDHIALSCEDVVVASRQLETAGYHVKFIHQDAPNRPAKRRFLPNFQLLKFE